MSASDARTSWWPMMEVTVHTATCWLILLSQFRMFRADVQDMYDVVTCGLAVLATAASMAIVGCHGHAVFQALRQGIEVRYHDVRCLSRVAGCAALAFGLASLLSRCGCLAAVIWGFGSASLWLTSNPLPNDGDANNSEKQCDACIPADSVAITVAGL